MLLASSQHSYLVFLLLSCAFFAHSLLLHNREVWRTPWRGNWQIGNWKLPANFLLLMLLQILLCREICILRGSLQESGQKVGSDVFLVAFLHVLELLILHLGEVEILGAVVWSFFILSDIRSSTGSIKKGHCVFSFYYSPIKLHHNIR